MLYKRGTILDKCPKPGVLKACVGLLQPTHGFVTLDAPLGDLANPWPLPLAEECAQRYTEYPFRYVPKRPGSDYMQIPVRLLQILRA